MKFLIDHNLRGHSVVLLGSLTASGWLDLVSIRFVLFEEVGLSIDSDDRVVWQSAQSNQMILLTANRSMKGKNSLEQVMKILLFRFLWSQLATLIDCLLKPTIESDASTV
jgi:predicted nuclease of predicted toxin-antitoxin system